MTAAAERTRIVLRFCVKIVILATITCDIVGVSSDNFAALALRELSVIDPHLLMIPLAEVTDVQVCLVVANRFCRNSSYIARFDCKLGTEALIAPRDV